MDKILKCLFFCIRNPSGDILDDVVKKVFTNYEIHSKQTICVVIYFRNSFNDYQNKYNEAILSLIENYKRMRYSLYFILFFIDLIMILIIIKF